MKPSTEDGDEDVLFASPETKVPCDWSPDGRFLVYYVPDPKTGTDLWILPVDTRVPSVFLRTGANELWGAVLTRRPLDGVPVERDRADMRFTFDRFLREAGRFRFPRPAASIRDGLATAKSCTSSPQTRS